HGVIHEAGYTLRQGHLSNAGNSMRWIVEGANAKNGRDVRIPIDAPDAASAEAVASARGMLVSRVTPQQEAPAAEFPAEADDVGWISSASSTPPISYQTPRAPGYDDIVKGAGALR